MHVLHHDHRRAMVPPFPGQPPQLEPDPQWVGGAGGTELRSHSERLLTGEFVGLGGDHHESVGQRAEYPAHQRSLAESSVGFDPHHSRVPVGGRRKPLGDGRELGVPAHEDLLHRMKLALVRACNPKVFRGLP